MPGFPSRPSPLRLFLLALFLPLLLLAGCNEPASEQDDDLDEVRLGSMDIESFGGTAVSRFELEGTAVLFPPETDGGNPVVDLQMGATIQGESVTFRLRGALVDEPGPLVPTIPHPLEGSASLESVESWSSAEPVIQFVPGSLSANARTNEVFVPFGQTDLFLLRYWHPDDEDGVGELGLGGLVQFLGIVPGEFTETGAALETGNVLPAQFVLRVPMSCAELAC